MGRDFRELAEEYAGRIFTYARYSLRHREDAEDVTQEVLVRLWKHHDAIEAGSTATWVMRVTRNLVIDVSRRRQARTAVFADGLEGAEVAALAATGRAPDAEAGRAEWREQIEAAVARLEEPYRSIVVMREIQGLAYEEIAEAMNMPLGTIKVYLHRARRRLRDSLRAETGDDV
jgi:RNA polymerase sigma-70 factor, ECF subfamily